MSFVKKNLWSVLRKSRNSGKPYLTDATDGGTDTTDELQNTRICFSFFLYNATT